VLSGNGRQKANLSYLVPPTLMADTWFTVLGPRMHEDGEIDVRACYTAVSVSFLLPFTFFLKFYNTFLVDIRLPAL
jgi:hypothetical protein